MTEIWKDISGYEGLYQVSNFGNVKRLGYMKEIQKEPRPEMILKLYKNGCKLWNEYGRKNFNIKKLRNELFTKKEIMMDEEFWKEIDGYPDYMISNHMQVKSLEKIFNIKIQKMEERILKPIISPNQTGVIYLRVDLCKHNKKKKFQIHRLVAQAFIPNPNNKPMVNHIDNDPLNNHVDNLEWVTASENMQHATRQGRLRNDGYITKPITQYDAEWNIIKEYASVSEAIRSTNLSRGQIYYSINRNVANPFFWKFSTDRSAVL